MLLLEFKIRKRRGKGLLLEFDYDHKREREISEREKKNELWNKIGARIALLAFATRENSNGLCSSLCRLRSKSK